jgi:hypothetical protein
MRTNKFVFQLFTLLVIAATILTACGPSSPGGYTSSDPLVLAA